MGRGKRKSRKMKSQERKMGRGGGEGGERRGEEYSSIRVSENDRRILIGNEWLRGERIEKRTGTKEETVFNRG